jgi:signal recognition particle receptor subunit beta
VVFFNYTTMQVSAKIVYYGAGLCGKTTNLQHIHSKTDPRSRGEMVSLETEADRTLFFDLLPLEVGTIGGMRVRVQLYTVPGQVFYNTTRKLVLKGVDGIVFVVDSQVPALDANLESFENLKQNLEELNQPLDRIPFIFQFNKRDIRNIHSVEMLNRCLNTNGHEVFGAAALHGIGVFETLKAISRKTLAAVHRRISGQMVSEKSQVVVPSNLHAGKVIGSGPAAPAAREPRVPTSAAPYSTSTALNGGTDEVKVEFAASLDATPAPSPPGRSSSVRKVATKSRLDIDQELDKLRRVALGNSPGVAKKKSKPVGRGEEDVCRELKVALPRATLEKAKELSLDLRIAGSESVHTVSETIRVDLPERPAGKKRRLRITLDLEGEDS